MALGALRFIVDISSALATDLQSLTDGFGQTDLTALLTQVVDDVGRAVRSYAGMTLTIVDDGRPFTMTVMNDGNGPQDVVSSAALQLDAVDGAERGSEIVFYARCTGGLVDFAADLSYALHLPLTAIEVDGHRPPAATDGGLSGLTELMHLNQAVGILIEQGFTAEEAHVELGRVAHNTEVSVDHLVRKLIRATSATPKWQDGNNPLN
jgi:hypothetical protein